MRVIALYGPPSCGKSTILDGLRDKYLNNVGSFRSPSVYCGTVGSYGELSCIMKPDIIKKVAIWPDGDSEWLINEGFSALDALLASGVQIDTFVIASRDRLRCTVRYNCSSRGYVPEWQRKGAFKEEGNTSKYSVAVLDALHDSINNRDLETLIDVIFL